MDRHRFHKGTRVPVYENDFDMDDCIGVIQQFFLDLIGRDHELLFGCDTSFTLTEDEAREFCEMTPTIKTRDRLGMIISAFKVLAKQRQERGKQLLNQDALVELTRNVVRNFIREQMSYRAWKNEQRDRARKEREATCAV